MIIVFFFFSFKTFFFRFLFDNCFNNSNIFVSDIVNCFYYFFFSDFLNFENNLNKGNFLTFKFDFSFFNLFILRFYFNLFFSFYNFFFGSSFCSLNFDFSKEVLNSLSFVSFSNFSDSFVIYSLSPGLISNFEDYCLN